MRASFLSRGEVIAASVFLGAVCLACQPAQGQRRDRERIKVSREAVDAVVNQRVEALWKGQNKDGHWDPLEDNKKHPDRNRGGKSALALLALKVAVGNQIENDPRFRKALAWLVEQDAPGTYFRGLRGTLYGQIENPKIKPFLFADADFLLNSFRGKSLLYSYVPPDGDQAAATGGDRSNTQYGILGVWSASDHDYEVPQKFWQLVEESYIKSRCTDGGWCYMGSGPKSSGSMTVAGLATAFVIWEKLYVLPDRDCRGRVNPELVKAIEGGLGWMADNFATSGGHGNYYIYGVERVGVASGLKYFGDHDWYKEITQQFVNQKGGVGGDVCQNAWALLFLCYGRAPVAFNKLKYGHGWNEHPREYAMLCRWLSKTYEKHHNWQIMPINPPHQEDFHDAPILAMSGRSGFTLKKNEIEHVRTYLLRGGMLFGEAIDGSAAFRRSFAALCTAMFPQFELARLPADHPIYNIHFPLADGQPELLGLSDGVRTLAVLSTTEISCDWQRQNAVRGNGRIHHELAANLVQYASDKGQLWSKEESYWPSDDGKKPADTITLGRVVHGGAAAEQVWNPSGGQGWVRLDILSRNAGGPAIQTVAVDLAGPVDPAKLPVLHLTGVGQLRLTDAQKSNLKTYLAGGGVLLADAAGGQNKAFTDSFSALCDELFGARSLRPLSAATIESSLKGATDDAGKVWYRHKDRLPRSLRPLEVLGAGGADGSPSVLFVPYDLTYALVGSPASDPAGLEPASAEKLAMAMLRYRPAPKPAPATPAGN